MNISSFVCTTPFPRASFVRASFACARLVALLFGIGIAFAAYPAWSALQIDITKGGLQPLPIAIPTFVNLSSGGQVLSSGDMGRQVANVVSADLQNSGLFQPLDRKAFLQDAKILWRSGPQFRGWRQIGADAVVAGGVRQNDTHVTVDFFLYDVFQGTMLGKGKRFSAANENWRHVAHRVADEIYTRLTGEGGYFSSRIAFIAEQGKQKKLSMMDQDGANRVDLTHGESLVLTPRFSPDGDHLFYISYETGQPRIFRWNIYSGKRVMQGNYPGLNSAPSWSPDGQRMAMTLSKDGNPEIYVKNLGTGQLERMTKHQGIDTSPSWSPSGREIVFNSNRAGSPQLYVMDVSSGDVRRITFTGSYNAAPSWSPRGDLIAFVHGGKGQFRIAVIDPGGKQMRILTDSWMDESPTWSPNGRVVLFSRQTKGSHRSQLYTIDLTGHNERVISWQGSEGASDPSWSPRIR